MNSEAIEWQRVARYRSGVRGGRLSVSSRLASRLFRDGFHALGDAYLGSYGCGRAWCNCYSGAGRDGISAIARRAARHASSAHYCHARASTSSGASISTIRLAMKCTFMRRPTAASNWDVAYTFPRGAVRHVHNIVYDEWANCLWLLTGDKGSECRILRASCDFKTVDVVLSGQQQARAAALVPTSDATVLFLRHSFRSRTMCTILIGVSAIFARSHR